MAHPPPAGVGERAIVLPERNSGSRFPPWVCYNARAAIVIYAVWRLLWPAQILSMIWGYSEVCWHDKEPNEILATDDGSEYEITQHAKQRMLKWGIKREELSEVLVNWTAKKFNPEHNSVSYFGFVSERTYLLMAAASENGQKITTVYFDRTATRHYRRGNYRYFDETRNDAESRIR